MAYADKTKKAEYDSNFHKSTYFPTIGIKIRRTDEDFYNAIQEAAEVKGITPSEYMRRATREQLIRDGFL